MLDENTLKRARKRKEQRWPILLGAGIFMLVGAVIVWVAIQSGLEDFAFFRTAVVTHGTVLETGTHKVTVDEYDDEDSTGDDYQVTSNVPYAKVTFQPPGGSRVTFEYEYNSSDPPVTKGDTVTVYYDPQHPTHAKCGGFLDIWGTSLVALVFGVLFMASGFAVYMVFGRKSRAPFIADAKSTYEEAQASEAKKRTPTPKEGRASESQLIWRRDK